MPKGERINKKFNQPENSKRGEAKLNRNKGQKAMEKSGLSHSEWSKKFDPLYGVKGMERHKKVNNLE